MTDDLLALASTFDPVADETWLAAVQDALRGGDPARLTRSLAGGLTVPPLFTPADASPAEALPGRVGFRRGVAGDGHWGIRARQVHPDPVVAHATILDDLEQGADQVSLRLDRATRAGTSDPTLVGLDGIAVAGDRDVRALLDSIHLDLATVALEPGASFAAVGAAVLDEVAARGLENAARVRLGADPLGTLAATGVLPQGIDHALEDLANLASRAALFGPDVRAVAVDAGPFSAAGATDVDDVALLLAAGVTYLKVLTEAGVELADALGQVELRVPVGVDQFVAIAKLRAVRRVWARVAEASGADSAAGRAQIHAELSDAVVTARDPWVNMLRGTVACFAAAVGGADSVTLAPFDAALGVPSDLGRRIARNTQLILQRESRLDHVVDPAGGSWYVDRLTDQLAQAAWARFQQIEEVGGLVAALEAGMVHAMVEEARSARDAAVATRRQPVTGVSEFPNLGEEAVVTLDADREAIAAAATGRRGEQGSVLPGAGSTGPTEIAAFLPAPVAASFEALRDASDAQLARTGARPSVLLVPLGPVARHTARATFARNFYEAGGLAVVEATDLVDEQATKQALADAGTTLAVVCGDDEQYADAEHRGLIAGLAAAGARVVVAGRPDGDLEAAGASAFIHLGCDVVDALRAAHDHLGVVA